MKKKIFSFFLIFLLLVSLLLGTVSVAASESKYWYSIIDITYLDQQREGVEYVFYDFSRDKERPQKISPAKNYNNKSQLGTLFRNAFNNNGLYVVRFAHNW